MDGSTPARDGSEEDTASPRSLAGESPVAVIEPRVQRHPVVIASPHSGTAYPEAFLAQSRLDPATLRKSEDSFVDELLLPATANGIPLLRANFPRAYVDVNREPFELDPRMFEDPLPDYVTTRSPRITAGLGTIARVVASGYDIYARKLRFAEAVERIGRCYRPYHDSLSALIAETRRRFGLCILIDGHSMPSSSVAAAADPTAGPIDFVLGDSFGGSCAGWVTDTAERALRDLGYLVARNDPYPGGYVTRHYGRPSEDVHVLQVEINRGLYMDERTYRRSSYLPVLARHLTGVVAAIGEAAGRGR